MQVIENEGRKLAGAFNTGMRHADTEFVAILLADDLWAPDTVAVLEREIATRPDVDFFHSARRAIDSDGTSISSVHPARSDVTVDEFADPRRSSTCCAGSGPWVSPSEAWTSR